MLEGRPAVTEFGLTDPQGQLHVAAVPGRLADSAEWPSLSDRHFFAVQRDRDQGTHINRMGTTGLTPEAGFVISRRRAGPGGSFNGTVHVGVSAAYFSGFWAGVTRNAPGATVALLRMDGEVLARYPEIAEPLARLTPQIGSILRRVVGESESGVERMTSPIDGVLRIIAYARVGDYPVLITYSVPVASVLAEWRRNLLALGGIFALAVGTVVMAMLLAMRDASSLAQERMRRAAVEASALENQRLELVGQVSAGVAHDLSNVLQAVLGAARLIRKGAQDPERVGALAKLLEDTVRRGSTLTRQMLDLSRRELRTGGEHQPSEVCDPLEAVQNVSGLLTRSLAPTHQLRVEFAERLPARMRGNRAGLEAALLNLAANARDAMPEGGEVVIRVEAQRIGDGATAAGCPAGLGPGPYVRISVTDTGIGMTPEVLARAGEPFFTTKPRGRGTGLGLAAVRGFAQGTGGALAIRSAAGQGTTVTMWLPAVESEQAAGPGRPGDM